MTSNFDISDFSSERWAKLLHQNYDTNIENFANIVSKNEFGVVHYDVAQNKLVCGRYSLNLSEFLDHVIKSPKNQQILRKRNIKAEDGSPIVNKKIQHLAECIYKALNALKENRPIESNQPHNQPSESKKTSQIVTKTLKRSASTEIESPKKKVKIDPQRPAMIVEKEVPIIRKHHQKILDALNENLSHASSKGDVEECKRLIMQGARVNDFSLETTPLFNAIKGGHLDLVEFLLASGANPNLTTNSSILLTLAVADKKYEICRCLLKYGADINAKDTFENTALIAAAKSGDTQMVDLLLEYTQLDLNACNSQGKTALFYAVRTNQFELCEKLLKFGADPNPRSEIPVRSFPLEEAWIKRNLPIIWILIDHGAKIDYLDKKGRSLLMRAIYFQPEIFLKLLEKGADVEYVDKEGNTVLTNLKERRPFYYRQMVNALKSQNDQVLSQAKIFSSRLMVSHAWHLSGETTITNPTQSYKVSLTGSQSPLWFRQMYKNFAEFVDEYPTAIKHPELLHEALQFASGEEYSSMDLQFERIQTGLPTFIRAGFRRHAITFFIWGNRWVICNLGTKSVKPTHVFHFDPQLLTQMDLKKIERVRNRSPEEYINLLMDLEKKLNFQMSEHDIYMSDLSKEHLKMQTVGNCSWTSPMAGIFAFLMLDAINEVTNAPGPNEPMPAPIENSLKVYQNWERFQKIFSLKRMLKLLGKTDYNTDYNLIQRASDHARQDPVLDDRLTELMKKYEPQIIAEMKKMEPPMQLDS